MPVTVPKWSMGGFCIPCVSLQLLCSSDAELAETVFGKHSRYESQDDVETDLQVLELHNIADIAEPQASKPLCLMTD